MRKPLLLLLAVMIPALVVRAGIQDIDPMLQNPVITDTDLQVTVAYTPASGIYEYRYKIVSGPSNKGHITDLFIDLLTTVPQATVYDPSLYNDPTRRDSASDDVQPPKNSIPIGMQSPGPPEFWYTSVTVEGVAMWGAFNEAAHVLPGQSLSGFVIQSKAPPGLREFNIMPYFRYDGFPCEDECPEDIGPNVENYRIVGATVGPVLPEELKLYNGKGQSAAVNEFLAYSNLTATRITLPTNTRGFDLALKYGKTTLPSTFGATLNGVNMTTSFRPNPGAFDVVRIPLVKGTNTLLLSIEGLKPSGAQSRDTDRLTFIVP